MKNYKKIFSATAIAIVLSSFILTPVFAELITDKMQNNLRGLELPATSESVTTEVIIGRVIQAFLSVFGIVFLGLIIYGGYKWMTAQGREEEVKKAKDIIKAAVTGLIIVFAAYAISVFVIASVENAAGVAPRVLGPGQ